MEFVASCQKENKMRALAPVIKILFLLITIQAFSAAVAQERTFQMFQVMDMPREFNLNQSSSCRLEFQEEWIIDPTGSSISKTVISLEFPCEDQSSTATLPEGTTRLRNLSFEFSFLDLPEQMAKEIQLAIIALVNNSYPFPDYYDPQKQLLSVYFHEDWSIDDDPLVFTKKVRALSPVIWQQRQTAEGEPLHDAETGYPVYYKLKLERIELRQP